MRYIFDSHLDLAWNALSWNREQTDTLDEINEHERGMTDQPARGLATTCLPELRRGLITICLPTLLSRSNARTQRAAATDLDHRSQAIAYADAHGQLAYYKLLEKQGQLTMISTQADLQSIWNSLQAFGSDDSLPEDFPIAGILSMEGSDPIVTPDQAWEWWNDGLRVASLAHYGDSAYAGGTGSSIKVTKAGHALLREFQSMGMILDTTHLCDDSWFDAVNNFGGSIVATHNNARALVPDGRQFSDEQIKIIAERDGVLGVVLDNWMLCPDYVKRKTPRDGITLSKVVDHIDYMVQLTGNCDHVGIGSDLDGGFGTNQSPEDLTTIADLQIIGDIMNDRGYDDDDIRKVMHRNWIEFFLKNLPT